MSAAMELERAPTDASPVAERATRFGGARGEGPWRGALRRLWRRPSARASMIVLAVGVLVAFLAPLLPLPSPARIDLERALEPPRAPWSTFLVRGYEGERALELGPVDRALASVRTSVFADRETAAWLGTDAKGRDLLARIVWGSRVSFLAALCAAITSLVLGVGVGAVAGYAGGKLDELLMRAVDALYALPFTFVVIFAITLVSAWRAELEATIGVSREAIFYVLVGAVSWLTMARVVRGEVRALRDAEFVLAARLAGASTPRILVTHVVPNVLPIVVAYLTLSVPAILLTEAFLSFLGLGIEPPAVSWGLLASDAAEAINPLRVPWWLVAFPSIAMALVLLALNVLGDALRDVLDPRGGRR